MKTLGLLCLFCIVLHFAGFPSTMLSCVGSPHDWSHVEKQKGWFAYTGLSSSQVCLCELMFVHVECKVLGFIHMCM